MAAEAGLRNAVPSMRSMSRKGSNVVAMVFLPGVLGLAPGVHEWQRLNFATCSPRMSRGHGDPAAPAPRWRASTGHEPAPGVARLEQARALGGAAPGPASTGTPPRRTGLPTGSDRRRTGSGALSLSPSHGPARAAGG